MPSHTSHYLQPLDVAVFKGLKTYFYQACRLWIRRNPGRRLTRIQFGTLLNDARGKAATCANVISAFRATGVYPLNPGAIPEFAFGGNTEPTNESCQNDHNESAGATVAEVSDPVPSTSTQSSSNKPTPTRVLNELLPNKISEVRKRAKQISILFTSKDHIEKRKIKEKEKTATENKCKKRRIVKQKEKSDKTKTEKTVRKRKAIRRVSDSSCEEIP
ncbi:hypothetical protein QE152_g32036 [Popillia japonica]|uniref:DDE-1 domain-containing protein n=1 Tax=Popillia japonica TaxID=7064 RepID=A0AAW1J0E7_POPJA